ncbi:DUF817 domain-containing protein [Nitratireductor pacificus]|uniref:DUF817 domain-containing protein n=1 Tax=Nitratireductor pacificus pht-3B TaxID=391937 RepID=K2MTL5_9HYPH|nr:hypothetical protein NA2_02844 [Nitratireductor pacificus pht-3B]
MFGLKQAWACLFGGVLLALIIATHYLWPRDAALARYDFLFLAALGIQIAMLAARLETVSEAKVILIFHVVGTAMELFKTSAGSWIYPEASVFHIGAVPLFSGFMYAAVGSYLVKTSAGSWIYPEASVFHIGAVPLFSGFMYAAVGSYLARISRIFDMRYSHYPPLWATVLLAVAIYVNFFAHHFTVDIRYGLFAVTALLYLRTTVHYRVFRFRHRMPLLLGFLLVALFIWFAENIGTWSRAWIYPSQAHGWTPVSLGKLGAWYLLMIISFVLVSLVHRPRQPDPLPALPEQEAKPA